MALLEAQGVHVRFGDRVVLEEINLSVTEGELHGIMGPNGAGKTTFFNMLTGSVKPNRGRIRLDGDDMAGLSPHAIARKGVARSFQIMTLFNDFTARENVMVALPEFRARGFDARRAVAGDATLADEADAVLASVGLAEKSGVSAKLLSYGDRRALEIAVALAAAPARALSSTSRHPDWAATARCASPSSSAGSRAKLTIVVIEHDMRFLFWLADRISVIHWGQVIARGTPRELRENPWVRRSNLGRLRMILERPRDRHLLRRDAGAVRRVARRRRRRGRGAARRQRRRQDDDAALDPRASRRPRRGASASRAPTSRARRRTRSRARASAGCRTTAASFPTLTVATQSRDRAQAHAASAPGLDGGRASTSSRRSST